MQTSSETLRVLCIDDDAEFVEVLSQRLKPFGMVVTGASCAQRGYCTALMERPDLIITDYCMPGEFGASLLRRLREAPDLARIPAIVVTGSNIRGKPVPNGDASQTQLLRNLGAEVVLRKPLNWDELYAAIELCTDWTPASADSSTTSTPQNNGEGDAAQVTPAANHGEKTLLIVDDDSQVRQAIVKHCRRSNFNVLTAATGEDAISIACEHQPDAITLDVRLPDMDGLEVAQRLRDDRRTFEIPIIFVTGKVDRHFRETSRAVGGRYFLRKPFDPDLLVKALQEVAGGNAANTPADTVCN